MPNFKVQNKKHLPFTPWCDMIIVVKCPGCSHGVLAQLVARDIRIVEARGSTPLYSTNYPNQLDGSDFFHTFKPIGGYKKTLLIQQRLFITRISMKSELHAHRAVHGQHFAGHVGSHVGSQIQEGVGHVFHGADAAQGNGVDQGLNHLHSPNEFRN